jgi:hypothetical protein
MEGDVVVSKSFETGSEFTGETADAMARII